MSAGDILVYADPDGVSYVGLVDERWFKWPAEAHGWARRRACAPSVAEDCWELEPRLAALALRLSGAPW